MLLKFCEYLKILNCYIGEEKSQPDFMYELFALFVSEPYTDEDSKKDENDRYFLFSTLCGADISKKVYKGDRVLPKAAARFMISHFQKDGFVEFLDDKDESVLKNLCSQLSSYGIKCNIDNIADVAKLYGAEVLMRPTSECFHSFLEAALNENDTIQTGISAIAEIRAESSEATNQDTLLLLEEYHGCATGATVPVHRHRR